MADRFPKPATHIIPLYGDIRQPNLGLAPEILDELKDKIHLVFHLEEYNESNPNPHKCQAVNVEGTANVVSVANQWGCIPCTI